MVPGSSGLLFSVREDGPGTQSSKRTASLGILMALIDGDYSRGRATDGVVV